MQNGLQLLVALKGEEIIWDADFSEVYCYDGAGYGTNANEVDIYLVYEPFNNELNVDANAQIMFDGKNYITTKDRKATLKWTLDRDAVVYVKCVPHFNGASYLNQDWRIKLDLTGNSKVFNLSV